MENEVNAPKSIRTVGYCNPPVSTRFRKGQSGNPKGRPKGTFNMATLLERTLRQKVSIEENGVRKTVTKLEAALQQLVNKAASGGDLKALQLLAALVRSAEEREIRAPVSTSGLDETDQKVVESMIKRFERSTKGGQVYEASDDGK
jgi:hypothetical protein